MVVFFVHGDPPLSFLMVFMAPLLAGLLRGGLPSGSFFEPGGNGWAHPVRIARCWFQFIILHLLFGQRLCVGQFAPCHQPAVCHRTP
ncbi:TSCPD domain-containing protein, partial [Dysosmobacter welbionis]